MDIEYLLFLQNLREITNGVLNEFMLFVTHLGETPYILLMIALIYWCFNKKLGRKLVIGYGFACLINGFLKLTACVYRPWIRDARVEPLNGAKTTATGYSFPSGHSTGASSTLGTIANDQRHNKIIFFTLAFTIALVMLSRNYLGVHTPQDVFVGCFTGIFVVLTIDKLLKWESEKEGRDLYIAIGGIALAILTLIYILTKSYPIDYDASGNILVDPMVMRVDSLKHVGEITGILLGWLFEKRVVKFEVPESMTEKMTIFLPGILCLFAFSNIIEAIIVVLLGKAAGYIVGRILTMFFLVGLYPYIFSKKLKK